MANDYGIILDNMRYSYSSANCFNTCKYCFYLTYIEAKERSKNFFSDFGLLMHSAIEEHFKGNITSWDLPQYYKDNYDKMVLSSCPPYPAGMETNYYNDGLNFCNSFDFDVSKYKILLMEDEITCTYHNIQLIVKPDVVLQDNDTNSIGLVDFKTSKLKGNKKYDDKKIEEYKKQMYLYTYFIHLAKDIDIDNIKIWFLRNNEFRDIPVDNYEMLNTVDWFENTVYNIKNEEEWSKNTSKENNYFCEQLCSCRDYCKRD